MTLSDSGKRKLLLGAHAGSIQPTEQTDGPASKRRKPAVSLANIPEEVMKQKKLEPLPDEIARLITVDSKSRIHILRLQAGSVFLIGRDSSCDYILSDMKASRKHAKFLPLISDMTGEISVVCEDTSRYGVLVNGIKVDRRLILADGDEIVAAGQAFKLVHVAPPGPAPAPSQAADDPALNASENAIVIKHHFDTIAVTNKLLGAGTYARVYLGYDTSSPKHKQVAVKKQEKNTCVPGTHSGWRTELELIMSLRHPNINRILDMYEDDDHLYMILELQQIDLFGYIQNWGPLPIPTAKFVFFQLICAVKHLHDRGVSHRDIKPENIYLESVVSDFPRVCLGDFGLAYRPPKEKGGQNTASVTLRTFSFCGTLGYLPPEVFKQHITLEGYDPRALDMWSCGVTLFFALSGYHPFDNTATVPNWALIPKVIEDELVAQGEWPAANTAVPDGSEYLQLSPPAPQPTTRSLPTLAQELLQMGVDVGMSPPPSFHNKYSDANAAAAAAEKKEEGKADDAPKVHETEREYVRKILHGDLPDLPWLLSSDPAGQGMIRGLIQVSSAGRLTARDALVHEWFASAQPSLFDMYRRRVLRMGEDPSQQSQNATTGK
ncbi:hypothetical protein V8E36_001565 [Tilletia maclaganii]